jgi:hypothetical protein
MFYEVIGHSRCDGMSGPPLELNRAVPGGRVEMFAIADASYPGEWFYRFQYYHTLLHVQNQITRRNDQA